MFCYAHDGDIDVIWSLGDDFDGAVEMPNDGPLMEITLMVPCMDDDDPLMYMMIA